MNFQGAMPAMVATGGGNDNNSLLALALLAGRGNLGFGNEGFRDGRGGGGEGCVSNSTFTAGLAGVTDTIQNTNVLTGIGDVKGAVALAEAQTQLALAGAQSDITSQNQAQTIGISNQIFAAQLANANGFANTKDAVDSLSTQVAIGQGVTNTNIERLGWQLSREGSENTNKILAQMSNDRIADLEQRLTVSQLNEREERSINRGRESEINITNTNTATATAIQFQNQQQQQFQILANLAAGINNLANDIQAVRQTQSNVNFGFQGDGSQSSNATNNSVR